MPKKERDEVLSQLASKVFSTMLEDALMTAVLESHQAVARSRTVCHVCHTHCGQVHIPGTAGAASSRLPTPLEEAKDASAPRTATASSGKSNGNILLECVNCKRQIASTRYASHLADCMGVASSRRGAPRNATAKAKLASETTNRSASPYVGSENGNISDDSKAAPAAKGKGKSKAKRTDEAEFNINRKRPASPSVSPAKKAKKKATGSPASRVKADPGSPASPNSLPPPPTGSQSRVPSKLRDSSVVSSMQRDRRSSSPESPSRFSSPARSVSTLASAPSLQSPQLSSAMTPKGKAKNVKPPPPRLPSPPRPPPPPPIMRVPETDYLVDVEGEETGSSTDTDSD